MKGQLNREELMRVTVQMLEHVAQCARRGPHGEWVLLLDEPRSDRVHLGAQFLGEVARACGAQGRRIFDDVVLPPPEKCNERPIDPEWLALVDKIAEQAARDLNSYIVLVAVQNLGKMGLSTGGDDLPGEEIATVKEMTEDMPDFLRKLAAMVEHMVPTGKHKKEPTIEFMPGCFDDFPGTQEQLQEFIAEIRQLVASGELERAVDSGEATPLSLEEVDELKRRIEARKRTRQ